MFIFGTEPDKHATTTQNSALDIPNTYHANIKISKLIHGNTLFLQDGRANSLTLYIPGDLINTIAILAGLAVMYTTAVYFGRWTIRILEVLFEYLIAVITVMAVCVVLNVYWGSP